MRRILLVLPLTFACLDAYAAYAQLISMKNGRSVTGGPITICTYQYGGTVFERVIGSYETCPTSVEVQ